MQVFSDGERYDTEDLQRSTQAYSFRNYSIHNHARNQRNGD